MLTWLGQAGFVLSHAGRTVLIDPFLSAHPRRRVPPATSVDDLRGADLVLCTHEHADHFDIPTLTALAAQSPSTRFAVPPQLVGALMDAGIPDPRILASLDGQQLDYAAITVDVVPAEHGQSMTDAYGFGREGGGPARFVGYVVDLGGTRIYHAGDTTWWPGHEEALRALRIDVALLPINGRDKVRECAGIVGNLDAEEAVDLAIRSGARLIVPMHWDAIEGNGGDPAEVLAAARRHRMPLSVHIPERGRATWLIV